MVAGNNGIKQAKAQAECVGPSKCKRADCESDDTSFFPKKACEELEVSMSFPTCWDGKNIDSDDHKSHVSYDLDGGEFGKFYPFLKCELRINILTIWSYKDGDCPESHPVKIPEIQLFFRIVPYSGGKHVFADGTSFFHADYFSGWEQEELQKVLDECKNDSDAALPDAWCEDHVTFRDAPKSFGDDEEDGDDNILKKLKKFQPPPFDTSTITTEKITNVKNLPRGPCTGTLIPGEDEDDDKEENDEEPCRDYDKKFELLDEDKRVTCQWAGLKPSQRCFLPVDDDDDSDVLDICPVTCETGCTPENNSGKFKVGKGSKKTCKWAEKKTKKKCRKYQVYANCPITCAK